MNTVKKFNSYIKRYGVVKLFHKAVEGARGFNRYNEDRKKEVISPKEIEKQKNTVFKKELVMSIIIPVYNVPVKKFKQTLDSVRKQTYTQWQLCIADAGENKVSDAIKEIMGDDKRVKYVSLKENLGISGNSNKALELADGDFVLFLDHDDLLEPDALFELRKMADKGYEFIYTDEDKVTDDLDFYYKPYRKPDYNRNLFLSNNYICHLAAVRKTILDKAGPFRSRYDGAQDYDLFLRITELTDKIGHIPKVLYHWRTGGNSTSANPFNKEYAYTAGKRALDDYFKRNSISGIRVAMTDDPGYYRICCLKSGGLTASLVIDGEIINKETDYYLILTDHMKINKKDIDKLLKKAYFTKADIIVPRIFRKNRYVYNGIAKAGKSHTPSLAGCRKWYKGKFNLGVTGMDVYLAPSCGIMVKRELYGMISEYNHSYINSSKGSFKGIKMVYAPEATINI